MRRGSWEGRRRRRRRGRRRRRESLLLPITSRNRACLPLICNELKAWLGTSQEAEEISIRTQASTVAGRTVTRHAILTINFILLCLKRCFILFSLIDLWVNDFLIIGRGWAKYRDLSVSSRSIVFIIRSPSLLSYFNHFLATQERDRPFFSPERRSNYAWAEYYLQLNTFKRADHYL